MALGSLSVLNVQRSAGSGPAGHQFPLPNTIDKEGLQPHQYSRLSSRSLSLSLLNLHLFRLPSEIIFHSSKVQIQRASIEAPLSPHSALPI
jgi:hypothetical protein